MIQNEGKRHIKRYLASQVPSIGQCLAFGLGDKVEAATDTYLQFEVGRSDITLTSYDFINNKVVFKATLPDDFGGIINEVGLFSLPANDTAGNYGSKLVSTFDSGTEEWADAGAVAGTYVTPNVRIGIDGLSHTPALSTSKTDISALAFDFSGNSSADKFIFAYHVGNAFTSSIVFRFLTDASNYYSFTINTPTAGYKITELTKGSATATGTPDWGNITEVRVITTATAGGAAAVTFDGIRIEDVDSLNPDYVMVSRELLAAPFTKVEGQIQEIEFSIDVNV